MSLVAIWQIEASISYLNTLESHSFYHFSILVQVAVSGCFKSIRRNGNHKVN
jgi:hypothetical protein